jgi:hypothetical protein
MTIASEGGHWYWPDGRTAYEQPNKSKPGEMRPTSLWDAKKLGLYPSVTGVMDIKAKPNLIRWLKKQIVFACDTAPKRPDEDCEAWAERILQLDAEEGAARRARDTGTDIHKCIEQKLRGEPYDQFYSRHVYAALEELEMWCGLDGGIEKSVSHPLGYGGKCDFHKRTPLPGFVVDYKGKDFDESWEPEIWPDHWMQSAAYREALGIPSARCAILYVSRDNPGLARLVEIPQAKLDKGWRLFQKCLELWKEDKDYRPETLKGNENGERERAVSAL